MDNDVLVEVPLLGPERPEADEVWLVKGNIDELDEAEDDANYKVNVVEVTTGGTSIDNELALLLPLMVATRQQLRADKNA